MLQRGHYPSADGRLRGTFVLVLIQDPLPAVLGAGRLAEEVGSDVLLPYFCHSPSVHQSLTK